MQLRMLGGLALYPAANCGVKPLLLLAYLAVQGPGSRRDLAAMFWPGATDPLASLSVALNTLRKQLGADLNTGATIVSTSVRCDVERFSDALDRGDVATAASWYQGPFLAGVNQAGLGAEAEEWLLHTRERLAGRLRASFMRQAELVAATGQYPVAARLALQAAGVAAAAPASGEELVRLHRLLLAAGDGAEAEIRSEASELGLELSTSAAEARSHLVSLSVPVPLPVSRLYGREPELAAARKILLEGRRRLVCFHGPAGMGKTSLLEWLAAEFRAHWEVLFVPLEPVRNVQQLPEAILRAAGVKVAADREQLVAWLGSRHLLLVLDGFEHLAGEQWLLDLLESCPDLRVLLGSRRQPELPGQVCMQLHGLTVPLGSLADAPAVHLFVSAARRSNPDFDPTVAGLAAIARISELVGGSPLGLILAASWTRLLPVGAIAGQLEADLGFLLEDPAATPRGLQQLIDTSLELLDKVERRVLLRLAVFRGGFTSHDAAAVTGADPDLLARLVARSMLMERSGGRLAQHELLQAFMRTRLAADSELAESARLAHARRYLQVLAGVDSSVQGPDASAMALLEADHRNVTHAWQFAVETGETELLDGCALPLASFCDLTARAREGAELLHLASAMAEPGSRLTAQLNLALAWLQLRLGDLQEAGRLALSVGPALLIADPQLAAWSATVRATVAHRGGDHPAAVSGFRQLLALATDPHSQAFAHGRLGVALQAAGDYPGAREHYHAALSGLKALADEPGQVSQLLNLGALEMNSGNSEVARNLLSEGLELARRNGRLQIQPVLLHNLANLASKRGEHARAQALIQEALGLVRRSGERSLETGMLATWSHVCLQEGDGAKAERHAVEALELASLIADVPALLTALLRYAEVRLSRQQEAAGMLQVVATDAASHAWAARRAQQLLDGLETDSAVPGPLPAGVRSAMQLLANRLTSHGAGSSG